MREFTLVVITHTCVITLGEKFTNVGVHGVVKMNYQTKYSRGKKKKKNKNRERKHRKKEER